MDLFIKERRLRWLGHVLRMEDDRIPKQATRWQMDSCIRRRAGRPRSNWIDTVTRDLKSTGMAWEDADQAAVDKRQESPADAGIPARRKNNEKNSSISKL